MRISAFNDIYSQQLSSGDTILVTSSGSNAGFGPDVEGEWGDLSVVGLRQQVSIASNLTPAALGDVLSIIQTSPYVVRFSAPSNVTHTHASQGSNIAITAVFDGGGAALAVGATVDLFIPFSATLLAATLLADQSTSSVVSVWKDTYANYPPTIADAITGASPPTASAATKAQDNTLSGWNKSIASGDTLRFSVASNNNATRLTVALSAAKGT